MPWWGILGLGALAMLSLLMAMGIGMAISNSAAWVFLVSELAFVALIWAGLRWCFPARKQDQ